MRTSENSVQKLSEKGFEQRPERGFGRCKEGEGVEKSLLGDLSGYAIDASEAFRTVSEGAFSEVRPAGAGGHANREQFLLFGAATLNLLYVCVLIHDSLRKVSARPCDRARHFTLTLHLHTTLRG